MKKTNVFLVLVCLIVILVSSCVKDNETPNTKIKKSDKTSTAQFLKRLKTNSFEGVYGLSTKAGHKYSYCNGTCKGTYHVNCQGVGQECDLRANINIAKNFPDNKYDIYYTGIGINSYEPIEDSLFSMPARSLYIENTEYENGYIWMNIPEQELRRDNESKLFIYKDITFTDEPLFENL